MDKQEKIYRITKAYNNLTGYTTLQDKEKFEIVVLEIIKVLTSIIEET